MSAASPITKKAPPKPNVAILYNGMEREFRLHDEQRVERLLKEAIREFGIAANQHLLSLFNGAGAELPDGETLGAAGVKAGDHLVLRPGVVKGG